MAGYVLYTEAPGQGGVRITSGITVMTSPKVPCGLGDAQGVAQLVSSLRLVMPRVWPEVRGAG